MIVLSIPMLLGAIVVAYWISQWEDNRREQKAADEAYERSQGRTPKSLSSRVEDGFAKWLDGGKK